MRISDWSSDLCSSDLIKGLWIDLGEAIHFQAGQYINLALPGSIGTRAFSISSASTRGQVIALNIKLVPGAAGTGYVHETLPSEAPTSYLHSLMRHSSSVLCLKTHKSREQPNNCLTYINYHSAHLP